MKKAALQYHLNLGAADHLQVLHHAHESNLAIAISSAAGGWTERVYTKRDAILKAEQLEASRVPDCYAVQNPIKRGKTRAWSNLSCLANCFVDLDTYKVPELAGMDKAAILQRILTDHPDMPRPTMYADSGRGMYLVWTFATTKPVSFAPAWQVIENNLVELLLPYGADPKCRDASRVLRLSATENSKTLTLAGYEQIGEPVRFEDLQRFSNALTKAKKRTHQGNQTARVLSFNAGFATANKNVFTLAACRMQDIRKLAELRGGRLTDLRKTALFAYAMAAAWYCHSAESLENELAAFIEDCLADPEAYRRHMPKTVIKRKQQSLEGVTVTWNGKEYDARYRVRNSTLIRLLGITASEQSHLSCLIDKAEKASRNNERHRQKRRQQGMIPRQQYEQQAQERRQQAMELFAKGASKAAIAKALGVSKASVTGYLKGNGSKCVPLY